MKTTIYELLGMIKDGKAPKKIIHNNLIFDYADGGYYNSNYGFLFDNYYVEGMLDDEVEILETTLNTKNMNITGSKKIEHIKIDDKGRIAAESTGTYCYSLRQIDKTIIKKINEIINYINKE